VSSDGAKDTYRVETRRRAQDLVGKNTKISVIFCPSSKHTQRVPATLLSAALGLSEIHSSVSRRREKLSIYINNRKCLLLDLPTDFEKEQVKVSSIILKVNISAPAASSR